jgi:hypothetical protein
MPDTKLVDPIARLRELASASPAAGPEVAADSSVPYEMPLTPRVGARLVRLTCGSTYRKPIPVLYDAETRTTFPISSEG